MNRIYKVIWNEALSCFTAVGEYAKGRGKSSKSSVSSNATINTTSNLSTIKTLRLSAIGLGLLAAGFGMQANAVGTYFAGDDPTPKVYTNPLFHQTLTVQGGETVSGDSNTKNISVMADRRNKSLTIKLDENVDLGADGSLKMGDTLVDNSGIKITASDPLNNVVLGNNGLNNGNNQITGVADGLIALGSKDAINGGQLSSLATTVATNKTKYYSANSIGGDNEDNLGATGPNAIAMGKNAKAIGEQAIAIGSSGSGQDTKALGEQSIAIGANVVSTGASSIAIGGDDLDTASEVAGINELSNAYTNSDLIEDPNNPYGHTESGGTASVAIGVKARSDGNLSTAVGVRSSSAGDASSAFGMGSSANGKGSVALGAGSVANVAGGEVGYIPTGANTAATTAIKNTQSGVDFGAVSVGTGEDGGNRQIVNVAAGSQDSDAVNVSQLKAVTDIANRGWDISAQGNSGTASTVEPGESVDFNSTNSNIIVSKTANSNDVSFELNNDLDLGNSGSVSTGNIFGGTQVNSLGMITGGLVMGGVTTVSGLGVTVTGTNPLSNATLTSDGLSMIGGPSITKSGGVNAGNKRMINVDDGIQAKDAVNVSQLNSASAAARTEVAAGTNVSGVTKSTGGNGQDIYTVNTDGTTVSKGSDAVTVTAGDKDAVTNMTDYAIDLSDASKTSLVKADSAMQSVITQIDGEDVKTLDKTNNTANFLSGKNIILTDEDGDIKVSTLDEVEFTKVTTGDTLLNTDGVTIAGGFNQTVTLSNSGLNNGGNRIINVDDGQGDTDAVNVRQLNSSSAAARTKVLKGTNVSSIDFSTDSITGQDVYTVNADGTTVSKGSDAVTVTAADKDLATNTTDYAVDLSADSKASLVKADSAMQTVIAQIDGNAVKTLNQTDNTANFITGDNIVLTAENDGIKIATADDVTFTSVSFADSTVRLSSDGLNNGGNRIINVDDGQGDTDAVNVRQLNSSSAAAKTEVAAGTNVAGVTKSTGGNGQDVYTVNADGTTVSKGSDAVTVTAGDKDTATNMTDYAVDLSADSKASLVKADSAMQSVITQIDGDEVKTLNKTENTANFLSGKNIILTDEDGDIKVSTLDEVEFTKVTTGDTLLNTGGVSFLGGSTVSLSSNGLNNGNNQITNVASGVGDDFNAANIGDVNRASAAAKTEVAAGTNVAGVAKSTGSNGQDVYTVNADGVIASAGSTAVTVTAGEKDDTTNVTDYAVDLSADSKASLVKADSAMQTVVAQIDGNVVKTLNQTDNTANFITGDNIVLTAENDGIKIATAENVTFTSVTTGDSLLNTGGVSFLSGSTVSLSNTGLNNGGNKITNVDDGEADTDAVNVRQLNATNSTVDLGLNFTGDDTAAIVNRKLGQTLTIQGGATELTENNIGVIADEEGNLNVRLAEDVVLGTNGSVRMENTVLNNAGITITDGPKQTVTLSNEGLDNGNNRIIKVGEGIAPSDAVNFAQLTTTNNEIAKGIRIGDGNSANDQQFALGDTINVTGDRNLTTVASATGVQVKLNNQLDLGDEGSIQIGNSIMSNAGFTFVDNGFGRMLSQASQVSLTSRGLDNGGNTITNIGAGTLDSDAVNVGQLKEVAIALDQGWGITAQGDIATMVKQGDALDLNSTDGNIKVSRTSVNNVATTDANARVQAAAIPAGVNDISFDLNPDISLNSVTTGDTTINSDGLTIVGGPSITKSGVNAAGNKVTNIQNGEVTVDSQDAINGSQLYAQGSGISSIIGGATVYNAADGTFTNSNIGGTGEGSIDGAIASIRQGTIEISETVQINTTAISTNTSNIATNTTNIATNTTNIATNTSNITTNTTNIQSNTDKIDAGLNFGADSGADINKPVGDDSVLSFTGGNNITTTAEGSSIKFDLNGNINVDSVTTGTTVINSNGISMQGGPSMTAQGINAGSQRITGVADGIEATDAVNYSQLSALDSRLNSNMSDLGYKINEVEDDANAGISAAMAMSALPQAYISGKSLIGGGVSTYNGESAVAVGFSKLSNDGRWVIKVNGTADTQGNVGGAVGAGFHFD